MPKEPNIDRPPLVMNQPKSSDGDLIRKRAYEIYLERGKENGHDVEDWLQAEEDIRSQPNSVGEEVAA